jgi:cobalt-zinc-cadmium efflux system outer membrane protein
MAKRVRRTALLSLLFSGLALGSFGAQSNAPAATEAQPSVLSLAEARRRALTRNWDLLAARSDLDQAAAQEIVAREIQNPSLSTLVAHVPADGTSAATPRGNGLLERSYDTILAVSQLLELHGKRGLKRSSAAAGAAAARARFADARRVLDDAVLKAYSTAAFDEESARRLARTAASLRDSAKIAASRLAAGDISAADEAAIEVAADRFELDARAAEAAARSARIALDVLMGEPAPRGDWHAADRLEDLAVDTAHRHAPERPDLAAAESDLARAELDLELERARRLPDPALTLQYEHQPPDLPNTLGLGVAIDLPLWNRHAGEIAAAAVSRDRAARERERVRARIAGELATARTAFESALGRWQSFRQAIVPKAEKVRQTVVYAYQNGGASLLELLEAERSANDVAVASAQAASDAVSAAADLAAAANSPLFENPS